MFTVSASSTSAAAGARVQEVGAGKDDVVVVATKPLEPFVFVDSNEADGSGLRGYSIDVWNEIADRLDLETEWRVEESVIGILDQAESGDADVAIAGISMTAERETFVDFSHPYYDSGLQLAVRPAEGRPAWRTIFDLATSTTVLGLVGGLILLTALVAHVVWWTERRHNEEFPRSYREGIGEALWWSSVSVVTGGEAVKSIRRPISRLVAVFWMVIGLFLIAFVTAQAASSMTVNELQTDIEGLGDLAGRPVVTVEDTVADDYLADINVPAATVTDVDRALTAVAEGLYDAAIYDAPVLAYRVNTDFNGRLELAGAPFAPDPYGIALTSGSDLREAINAELLDMSRDGTLDALNQKWLGVDR